jgi:hypothetical protein
VPVVPCGRRATTKLIQENYFNPAPMGSEKYWIIKQYLHWPKFLEVIFCYCSNTWVAQQIRGCLLQLLLQDCQSPFLFFLESLHYLPGMLQDQETEKHESSQLKKLEWERVGQWQHSMSRHSWRPFWKTSDLELFSSTAEVSQFPEYQHPYERNATVVTYHSCFATALTWINCSSC